MAAAPGPRIPMVVAALGTRVRLALTLGALGVALSGCTMRAFSPHTRVIVDPTMPSYRTWGADGPVGTQVIGFSPGEAVVHQVQLGPGAGLRLVVSASDGQGNQDSFVIDSGATNSSISFSSPLSQSIVQSTQGGGTWRSGEWSPSGELPLLTIGSMQARRAVFQVRPRANDLRRPANVLGLDVLQGLVLARHGPGWVLTSNPRPPRPGAVVVRMAAAGLPLLPLEISGMSAAGLIDTGAPTSHGIGRTIDAWQLRLPGNRATPGQRGPAAGGLTGLQVNRTPVDVLIGLDFVERVFAAIDFRSGQVELL